MKKKLSVGIAIYQMARIFVTSREKRKQFSRLGKQVFATCVSHKKFSFGFLGLYRVLPVSGQCPVFFVFNSKIFHVFRCVSANCINFAP